MGVPGSIDGIQPFAELHDGSTTTVYKGYQSSLDRFVLLKVLKPAFSKEQDIAARFEEEARLVARVQHPNVVAIYDYGEHEGLVYISAEYVDGTDLSHLIEQGQVPPELATFILLEASKGLRAAHTQGILHRDLKPGNILIAEDGRVKLTDFGMASLIEESQETVEVRGTPSYLAPELVAGESPEEASDLFAMGALLFEMLAGRRAFRGESTGAIMEAVRNRDPLPQLGLHVSVPDLLYQILAKLLAKDPDRRYRTVGALIEDLEDVRFRHEWTASHPELSVYIEDPQGYREGHYGPEGLLVAEMIDNDVQPVNQPAQSEDGHAYWYYALSVVLSILFLGGFVFLIVQSDGAARHPDQLSSGALGAVDTSRLVEGPPPGLVEADSQSQDLARSGQRRSQEAARARRALPDSLRGESIAGDTAHAAQRAAMGQLRVNSTPRADVYVDGELLGTTPIAVPVRTGVHALVLRSEGLPEYQSKVRIRQGQETETDVSLWSQVGRLLVDVRPGTELIVDGEVRATSPQDEPLILPPGQHELKLHHPKLGTKVQTIRIAKGSVDTLRIGDGEERIGW